MKIDKIDVKCDILVIGGGVAGLFAALKAKQQNSSLDILLVDKCYPGISGASAYAAGVLPFWHPDDEYENYAREIIEETSEYLIDQNYVHEAIKGSYDVFQDFLKANLQLQRDAQGNYLRIPALGSNFAKCTPYYGGHELPWKMSVMAKKHGVKFLERIYITDLLTKNNVCAGAVGFNIRSGSFHVFQSKATVLANGSLFYGRLPQMGPGGTTGDAQALALRNGVRLRGLEQVWATHGPAMFDSSGAHVIFGSGGILVNSRNERFMEKYSPVLLEKSRRYDIARGIVNEWIEGRGPCYLDCTHLSEDSLNHIKSSLPRLTKDLAERDLDLKKDKIEWVAYGLTFHETGGIRVNNSSGDCDLSGLFAVGTAGDYCGGMEATAVAALPGASYTGSQGGKRAAEYARNAPFQEISSDQLICKEKYIYAPLKVQNKNIELTARKLTSELSYIIHKYVNLIKDENMLNNALDGVKELNAKVDMLSADDYHSLMQVHGIKNKIFIAEGTIKSALLRKESRACHYRKDYPKRNDSEWLKWIITSYIDGKIECGVENIPIDDWPYKPNKN